MNGEVDGCERGLQGGELGTGKGSIGHDAVHKGLIERGAEEGAIAGRGVGLVDYKCREKEKQKEEGEPEDMVGSGAEENRGI